MPSFPEYVNASRAGKSDAECWPFAGALKPDGYGVTSFHGTTTTAHRAAYELLVAPVPAGMHVHHECNNPQCVNPAHLKVVTPRENAHLSDTTAAKNARKTHCSNGHEYTAENTRVMRYPDGRIKGRLCRECHRIRSSERYYSKLRNPDAVPNHMRTHCPSGHEYTPDNIVWRENGRERACLICSRARSREYHARKRAQRQNRA